MVEAGDTLVRTLGVSQLLLADGASTTRTMRISTDDKTSFPFAGNLKDLETPAFVYDESEIQKLLDYCDRIRSGCSCRILFALKPFSYSEVLNQLASRLDGFAVSSLFEAKLASEVLANRGTIHITTPGIRPVELEELGKLCDFISFNSLSQWDRHSAKLRQRSSCGLRVNPQLSFLDDPRYDPCRPLSKLGVPLSDLASVLATEPARLAGLEGLQFHSNCESTNFEELRATVMHLHTQLGDVLSGLNWINLGGGYLFDEATDFGPLFEAVEFLRAKHQVQVYLEPGAALIRSAGYIVSTVLDVFAVEGENIAVLDTTVNHMPEVFEYGYEPDVIGHNDEGCYEYRLAGCTCLAGDLFGVYQFDQELEVGAQVVFNNAGAYTLAKAHLFNGVNLPTIYALTEVGELVLKKRFTYADFAERWGADATITD